MSRVFVATETALNRSVVIKVVAPDLLEGLSADRFAREVKLAARLQQANIVPVLSAGDANGVPYYTMPFVRGESLRTRMVSRAAMPVGDAVHVLRDMARALAYAHGEGIVHRDIKPENVLLSGGAAVVTDFGIAKALDVSRTHDGDGANAHVTLTRAGSSVGTPAYMSPEQAAGDPGVDHRADIYAWGLIAWELLAGRHPFAGKLSLQALVAAQMSETPASLSSIRADVPAALSDLVQQCLEKEPSRRPASATELLTRLDQVTSTGTRVVAPTAPSRRRGMVIGLAAFAIIVVAAALVKWRSGGSASVPTVGKSLAILPFATSAGDTSSAYFGEGIADEVTNELSQIPDLQMAGRSSAQRFAGKDAREAGKSLGVTEVLDGTVRRIGDRVRVTAELSNVSDGLVAWRETYDRPAADVFAVQGEIARAIAGRLQVSLTGATSAASGTNDLAAYEFYLKGLYLYRRRGTGDAITQAIAAFDQATIRDSNFARAWAMLALSLTVSPTYELVHPAAVLPRARAAAERAVRLDPKSSEAHSALGYVHAELFEWPEAEAEYNRAIALDPNGVEARFRLGYALFYQRRLDEALAALESAVARDRLYSIAAAYLGWAEVELGRTSEGLDEERRALALEPEGTAQLSILVTGYANAGLPDSARFYALRLIGSSRPTRLGVAAQALGRAGDVTTARALVERLVALPPDTPTKWSGLALAYAGLGESANAIDAIQHAAATDDGDGFPLVASVIPDELPHDARLDAALRRYRLDPARFARTASGSGR
jgi:eukaryotic-like serine/threonine-protein kinase